MILADRTEVLDVMGDLSKSGAKHPLLLEPKY